MPAILVHAPGAIHSYAGWTAWQDVEAGAYAIRVRSPGGHVTTRPERATLHDPLNPEPDALPFDLGPDAAGRPSIVIGACGSVPAPCRLRIARLPAAPSRAIAGTTTPAPPRGVTLWRGTLAWAGDDGLVRVRDRPGAAPRRIAPWPREDPGVLSVELRGRKLASVTQDETSEYGGNARIRVGLMDLTTGRRAVFGSVIAGESGQMIFGPAFVTPRTLGWLTSCPGDAGGCNARFGFYRRDLPTGRMAFARNLRPHEGWAPVGRRKVVVGPSHDQCLADNAPPEKCAIRERTLKLSAPPR